VPEICRFYGIVIAMFFDDHEPPHFHVRSGSHRAIIGLDTLDVLRGQLPPRALGLVKEWAAAHVEDLREDRRLARAQQPLKPIDPLQ